MRKNIFFPGIALLCAISAYFLQVHMFLNGDVGSLLFDTRLFLKGGTYLNNFLETNPPMIFIIYSPVIFFEKWTALNIVLVMRIYIILTALFSIGLSNFLLKKIIKPSDDVLRYVILLGLLFSFLLLPACEFGQREHFFIMLVMPYLFTVVIAAQQQKINKGLACLIAVMAALGIGMKPYFLAPFILVELYLMVVRKNIFSGWRFLPLAIVSLLSIYLIWVFIGYPTYIYQMLPLISDLYFISIKTSWSTFLANVSVSYCFFVAIACLFIFNKIKKYRILVGVLLWAFIGMVVAVVIPRAGWYYHILPAIILSVVLLLLYIFIIFSSNQKYVLKKDGYLALFVTMMVPLYIFLIATHFGLAVKKHSYLNQLIAYIQTEKKPPSIYCFSANTTGDCFTLVYSAHSVYAGRYPFFWWLQGLQLIEKKGKLPIQIKKDKKFLIDAVADDLDQNRPDWLIINTSDAKATLKNNFNFINYFSQNKKFYEAWKPYHYYKKVGVFAIYQRSDGNVS